MISDCCRRQQHKLCAASGGRNCGCGCHTQSDDERAWNETHGLGAICGQCGGAMRDDGRQFCSFNCNHRARTP